MKRIFIILILAFMGYYILEHSFFIVRTGVVLGALAAIGFTLYLSDWK